MGEGTKRPSSGRTSTSRPQKGVDTLRLVGDCTNICALYTAAGARNLGYAVEVVEDGVASFDEEAHKDALRELERTLGARMVLSARPA